MEKTIRKTSASAVLVVTLLLTSTAFPDQALAAKGVLKEGENHIHFNLTLIVNITRTAFNMTKEWFEYKKEVWMKKWIAWKDLWEQKREQHKEKWADWMGKWESWNEQWKEEWRKRWKDQWNETWKPEWKEKWDDWDEWMGKWTEKWREIRFEEMQKIPEFMRPDFKKIMMDKFSDLWDKHLNALVLANCWSTPASRFGLKVALGHSLNKSLERIYNTSDVYIKNFDLTIDLLASRTIIDDTFVTMGIFNITESFDLHGVVMRNSSGTFIRSQFRSLNVTERVDGTRFGYPGWVFVPGKAMFMDLTVFSVPLEEWERKFDPATNTTTFALAKNINVTTPFGSVIVDPELSLIVPGDASGVGDVIVITPILPTDLLPIKVIVPTAAIATVAVVAYYLMRKKTLTLRRFTPSWSSQTNRSLTDMP